MNIWLVSIGRYSDYDIHSAWSTKELAEKAVERIKHEYANEGYDEGVGYFSMKVDELEELISNSKQYFRIWMNRDGECTASEVMTFVNAKYNQVILEDIAGFKVLDPAATRFYGVCKAEDVHQAVKIINERRIQWLSTNK